MDIPQPHLYESPNAHLTRSTTRKNVMLRISEDLLEKHYVDAYGIFAGVAENLAILLFSAEAARWVADEQWHPKQVGKILKNGRYELKIPYGDPRELIMEILKYGAEVEVIGPPELRALLIEKLTKTLGQY